MEGEDAKAVSCDRPFEHKYFTHTNLITIFLKALSKFLCYKKILFEISKTLTWAYYIITKEQVICIYNNENGLVPATG